MGVEIERKFLLSGEGWRDRVEKRVSIKQGYICRDETTTVRVRLAGDRGVLTLKGKTVNTMRAEFEFEIPLEDARAMLDAFADAPPIVKTRHYVRYGSHLWEIDVFDSANKGLVIAEVELDAVDEAFDLPPWIGREVTSDDRVFNASLCRRPFMVWTEAERRELLA